MAIIASTNARRILDSRGEWTIEVTVRLDNGLESRASVPQGKSRGSSEAIYVEPEVAVRNVQGIINGSLTGVNPEDQEKVDANLMKFDGTSLKSNLGANAILGVSLAVARAAALAKQVPLWKYLRQLSGLDVSGDAAPRLYINVINGGAHAGNNLDFQEYLIIPKEKNVNKAVEKGLKLYNSLRRYIEEKSGRSASAVGDEGGFAPDFKDNREPFVVLSKVVKELGLEQEIEFGIDAAANNLDLPTDKLLSFYRDLKKSFDISYIEDPFGEEDFENFALLLNEFGGDMLITGDDLTTTNMFRMEKAHDSKSVNSVIIKPNQIGTLTETLDAVKAARGWGWNIVVSHRSGETNDDFIADLAYAIGADGLKLGAPARGERIAKYNRLLAIEKEF